jgi:flagellar biogenesis protein FliO
LDLEVNLLKEKEWLLKLKILKEEQLTEKDTIVIIQVRDGAQTIGVAVNGK